MKKLKYNSLDEILRGSISKKDEERSKTVDNNWIWASELGMCPRAQFLRRLGIPSKRTNWRFTFCGIQGSGIHDKIEAMVKESKTLIVSEERFVDKKLRYKGRMDLLVNLNTKKDPYLSLIDIKTQRPEAFFRRKKLPFNQRVSAPQKLQLCSYTYFAKKKWPGIKDSRIYYMDRGGGLREEYIFHFTKKDFQNMLREIKTMNNYWDKQIIPPCSKTWLCANSCRPYRKELLKVESGEITIKEFIKNYVPRKNKT